MDLSPQAIGKMLATVVDALLVVDVDGRIVFVNPQAERLFGYDTGELPGQQVEVLLPEALRDRHARQRERYRGAPHARPLVSGLNLQGRRKGGQTFDAEISLTPLDSGDETFVVSSVRDIGDGDASEAYFRQLLQAAPDAMIIVDDQGLIAIANDQSEKMFGYRQDELLGKPVEMLLPETVRGRHVAHREGFVRDPRLRPMGIGMELFAQRADGSQFPVEISLSPITAASGTFVSSVIRDVTERKDMEKELIDARRAAERAHKANTAFLAAASHDLRQPVQALSLLTGALRRTVDDELAQEMIDSQQHSLDAMTNLLNSLLDISRLDAGAIEPEIEVFPIQRLIDRLSAEFTRQATQKHLAFRAEPSSASVRSDPNLLAEIIQNLVSNALRYTERGEVLLCCREERGYLYIDVIDTGIGIAEDDLDDIFREFHQLKSSEASSEGFGLGLAIVRRLADLLGHDIRVTSQAGEGSRFTVSLPLATAAPAGEIGDRPPAPGGRREGDALILIVEDDRRVAAAWTLLLRAEGYVVRVAETADAARRAVSDAGQDLALIVSDYHLRDGSTGVQAVTGVRESLGRDVPAFIVSGDTSKVVDDARRVSNSLLLAKPVNSDELLERARAAIEAGSLDKE